jgi:DNA-directed RNA polymerase subunit RPC12/RpoP
MTVRVPFRCPYCTDRNDFKLMVGHLDGRHICARCGHLIRLDDATFVCTCSKCLELNRPLHRIKHSLGLTG